MKKHHLPTYYKKNLGNQACILKLMDVDEIIKCFFVGKSTSWSKGQVTYKEQEVVVKTDDEVILNSYSGSRLRPFTSYGELNLLLSYMTLYVCLMSDLCKASHPSQLGAAIKGNFHRLLTSHSRFWVKKKVH